MNISVSDIIWTIICFLLFTLVLNGLLIKPVLKVMDERNARLSRARARGEELAYARAKAEKAALEAEAERERSREEGAKLALARAEEEARSGLKALEAELKAKEEGELAAISGEAERVNAALLSKMDGMVEAFTQKLVKGGES